MTQKPVTDVTKYTISTSCSGHAAKNTQAPGSVVKCSCMHGIGKWYLILQVNTLRPKQNGRHIPDDIFKHIFLIENVWISIKISLKFVHKGPIDNNPADNGLVRNRLQAIIWTNDG